MPSFYGLLDDTCFNRWNVPVPLPRTTNKIPVKNTLRINNFAVLWQPAQALLPASTLVAVASAAARAAGTGSVLSVLCISPFKERAIRLQAKEQCQYTRTVGPTLLASCQTDWALAVAFQSALIPCQSDSEHLIILMPN